MTGPERAILVGLLRPPSSGAGRPPRDGREPNLDELSRLAESAGAVVAAKVLQKRRGPDPTTFVGDGKVEDLKRDIYEHSADLVILDGELTPAQQRNLERRLEVKVIDRTALVLDIFARRAHTKEGRLQVELAQMTYLLPRLTGRGVWLSRLGGGIGTRGPGETKLEVDRRRIRRRITDLGQEIAGISRHRALQRQARREAQFPVAALVGYTNAGKSTLLNALTDAGVFVEDKLFATLDPTIRKVTLPNHRPVLLVDTVGFISRLPTQLVAAFRATLEEVTEADLLIHVVDASHAAWRAQIAAVHTVLKELDAADKPVVYAVNKIDRLASTEVREVVAEVGEGVPISALQHVGLINLLRRIAQQLPEPLERVRLLVPYAKARTVSEIFGRGRIISQEYGEQGIAVEAELPRAYAQRLRALYDGTGSA
ncbi:MAG: GTPase HflX [Bacillati bacterium ANGP1]|uniref:GTPase HflX n=1 Tax=Candidatus Segetimicrobium genomatis TaxID=2569760 RepID=A0A537IKK6_9BACT|nr:MAG: GTPase HflX [Terrabacteria group bacterium ANGP1]